MQLIRSVRIAGFRSIANEIIEECGENFVLVGKNSSGKSNVLRALNVFFNGETSPGVALDFERDIYFRPLRKQKKVMSVEVCFALPSKFNFRNGLKHLEKYGAEFTIRKSWELDPLRRIEESAIVIVDGNVVEGSDAGARDFLSLIRFRYIPNRTVPAELLRDESQVIAGAIFKKMKESSKAHDILKGMAESAGKLLNATSEALKNSGAPLQDPNILTAETLGEMLRMSGFKAVGLNGASVRDEDWGAGHQAFFLMNLLREIDTDYSRQFGWRQACVWAVEEPESGLHHDLQTRIAKLFLDWAADKNRRLQIFTTTHAPVIAMAADSGCLVELNDTTSSFTPSPVSRLVRLAEDRGVTTYLHPALAFPFNPVVVVEGQVDEQIMNHVAKLFGYGSIRFVTLPAMDDGESTGIDAILGYLKRNSRIIRKRATEAPLICLVDWEVSNEQMAKLRSAYGSDGVNYIVRCNAEFANPLLGISFRGIERFYPEDVVRDAHEAGEIAVGFPSNQTASWSVSSEELSRAKLRLANRVMLKNNLESFFYLAKILRQVIVASESFAKNQMSLIV